MSEQQWDTDAEAWTHSPQPSRNPSTVHDPQTHPVVLPTTPTTLSITGCLDMTVYCASKYARREQVAAFVRRLPPGIRSISSWVRDEISFEGMSTIEKYAWAVIDSREARMADALVYWSDNGERVRGGKCVELGIAIGAGTPCIIIGDKEHIFSSHPGVMLVRDEDEAIMHLLSRYQKMVGLYTIAKVL